MELRISHFLCCLFYGPLQELLDAGRREIPQSTVCGMDYTLLQNILHTIKISKQENIKF